jgi:hypothetical protein
MPLPRGLAAKAARTDRTPRSTPRKPRASVVSAKVPGRISSLSHPSQWRTRPAKANANATRLARGCPRRRVARAR